MNAAGSETRNHREGRADRDVKRAGLGPEEDRIEIKPRAREPFCGDALFLRLFNSAGINQPAATPD